MNRFDYTRAPEKFTSTHRAVWTLILSILIAIQAYFTMLTGFSGYDDEGTMMLTVKQYLDGMRIYSDISTIYGPVYYFYNAIVRAITATPVTHEVTRMSSLLPWLFCSIVCGWIVLRLTRSLVFSAAALTAVCMSLGFFRNEPGHPQELTLALLVALAACPLWMPIEQRRNSLMFTLGALAGALLLVKINIGIYVAAALALTLVSQYSLRVPYRALSYVVGAGCISLPTLLMRTHLGHTWARTYDICATTCIAGVVLIAIHTRPLARLRLKDVMLLAAGYAGIIGLAAGVLVMTRVSLKVVVDALVWRPARVFAQSGDWFVPARLSPYWVLWSALGLIAAITLLRDWRTDDGVDSRRLATVKLMFSVVGLLCIPLRVDLVPAAGSFAWLVLLRPGRFAPDEQTFPRVVLCVLTAMQSLYGFPVYGSQAEFMQCLFATVVIVCAGDALEYVTRSGLRPIWFANRGRSLALASLALLVAFNAAICWNRYRNYVALPALDLPGSHSIHVDWESKTTFETLSCAIDRSCDALETIPQLPSFTFWTRKFPPAGANLDQSTITAVLSRQSRPCILYNPRIAAMWNPANRDLTRRPLVSYMRENLRPSVEINGYQLMVRK